MIEINNKQYDIPADVLEQYRVKEWPQVGDRVFVVELDGEILEWTHDDDDYDRRVFAQGRAFRTREEAEAHSAFELANSARWKAIIRINDWAKKNAPFERKKGEIAFQFHGYNDECSRFGTYSYHHYTNPDLPVFKSQLDIDRCATECRDDLLIYWRVK